MSDLAAPPRVVVVTDETTLEDLADTLSILNGEAKTLSRRGRCGTETVAYEVQHARIDAVLDEWLAKAHAGAA